VYVFAGQTVSDVSDLYIYDVAKGKWSRPLYEGEINVRAHAAAVLHDKLIVFGGCRSGSKKTLGFSSDDDSILSRVQGENRISKKLFFLSVLEIRDSGGEGDFKFKLIHVGDSNVGKSCLLSRFVQDVYTDFHVSTIGVDFKSLVTMAKGKLVTLQLWDTAGQERFSGVTGNYYRNADGFILVFDATRRESFDHIEQWLKQIREHHECGPSTLKILVGNKYDLVKEIEVTEKEGRAMAEKIGAMFVATSAKTAANVDTAFLTAVDKLIEMRKKQANNPKSLSLSVDGRVQGGVSLSTEDSAQSSSVCGGCGSGGRSGAFSSPSS